METADEKYQHVVMGTKRSDPKPFNCIIYVFLNACFHSEVAFNALTFSRVITPSTWCVKWVKGYLWVWLSMGRCGGFVRATCANHLWAAGRGAFVLRAPNGPFRARLSEQRSNTCTHAQIKCTHTHVAAKSTPELSQTYCLGQEKHFVYA